jgi:hypothetical protein
MLQVALQVIFNVAMQTEALPGMGEIRKVSGTSSARPNAWRSFFEKPADFANRQVFSGRIEPGSVRRRATISRLCR